MLSLVLVLVLVLVRVLVLVLVFVLVMLLLVLLLPKRLLKLSNAAPTQSPDEDELFVASTIRLLLRYAFQNRKRAMYLLVPPDFSCRIRFRTPKGSVLCTSSW